MHPMFPSGASTPGSGTPTFPMPQRNQTTPTPTNSPPLHQLRPVLSDTALSSHSARSSRVHLPVTPNQKPRVPDALEELHQGLNYPEGEMPVSLWVLIKPSRAHNRRPIGPRERR